MKAIDWIDERLDLSEIRHFVAEKGVPVHTQKIWYYLGGMTLFLFGVQVFTGILLLLYYRPSAGEAYESVQFIVTQVQFGWLIRNVHSWSANLLIGLPPGHWLSGCHREEAPARRTPPADAVLPELHPARRAGMVRGHRRARGARGILSVGAGHQGGSVRGRAARDPPGVVLPGDVPHAE